MMNNMFSMFDPSSSYMSTNWAIMFLFPIIVKSSVLKKMSKVNFLIKTMKIFIKKEINQMMEKKIKFTNPMFMVVFFLVFMMNIMAIFPFNFTPTAHMSISFTMSTSMWVSTMLFSWKNHFNKMMTHLTPMGTPNALMNFMVIIETISLVIRPITLSIRLSANMVAGHLLMSLLSSFSMGSNTLTLMSLIPSILLMMLEMGVALVQSYVLMTLMILYQNETT